MEWAILSSSADGLCYVWSLTTTVLHSMKDNFAAVGGCQFANELLFSSQTNKQLINIWYVLLVI